MRELVIGIDSGTQSTKALVVDAKSGKLLGEGSRAYGLISGLPAGAKEQHPADWIDATESSIRAALKQAKATAGEDRSPVRPEAGPHPGLLAFAVGGTARPEPKPGDPPR